VPRWHLILLSSLVSHGIIISEEPLVVEKKVDEELISWQLSIKHFATVIFVPWKRPTISGSFLLLPKLAFVSL